MTALATVTHTSTTTPIPHFLYTTRGMLVQFDRIICRNCHKAPSFLPTAVYQLVNSLNHSLKRDMRPEIRERRKYAAIVWLHHGPTIRPIYALWNMKWYNSRYHTICGATVYKQQDDKPLSLRECECNCGDGSHSINEQSMINLTTRCWKQQGKINSNRRSRRTLAHRWC